jgi:hypothetical protein
MSSSRPWVKVWQTWWTSPSHVDLDLTTLAIGLRVMSLTGASPDQEGESRYCLRADGAGLSLTALARECRCTVGKLSMAIDELVAVGTMLRRADGAIGFVKWDEYQLSPRALRDRRKSAAECAADCRQTAAPTNGQTHGKRSARGQRSEVRESALQTPPDPPRTAGLLDEDHAVAWLRDRLPYSRRPQGANALPVLDAKIREMLRAGFTAERILAGTETLARAIDAGQAKRADWRGTYVFSVGWFERIEAEFGSNSTGMTAEQAAEYVAKNRRAPPGWRFDAKDNLVEKQGDA